MTQDWVVVSMAKDWKTIFPLITFLAHGGERWRLEQRPVAAAPLAADTPALAGLVGRLRLQIGGNTVGVLVVHDGHLELTADDGSVDATMVCGAREDAIAATPRARSTRSLRRSATGRA